MHRASRKLALAALPFALLVLTSSAAAQKRVFHADKVYDVPVADSARRGPDDALVTIVEFADFRCGACRLAHVRMQDVLSLYPGDVRFVYKHFVIFGDPSLLATMASMAAGEQGKFWAMHDRIFTGDTRNIDREMLDGYARDIGLDMARYRAALESESPPFKDALIGDLELGSRLGIEGTPIFFVNGRPINGAAELGTFIRVIDEELKRARYALQDGADRASLYDTLITGGEREGEQRLDLDPAKTYRVGLGDSGHVRGPADALVTLVMFEDFECHFCARMAGVAEQLAREYGKDLRVVFRHMPLGFHEHAQLAHEAAMAAAAQGKFWEMHDVLFRNQRALERSDLERYAAQLGLDMKKFRKALDDGTYRRAVAADKAAGEALSIRGTPTSFINGNPVVGAQRIEVFRAMIEAKKIEAEELVRQGTKRADVYRAVVGVD